METTEFVWAFFYILWILPNNTLLYLGFWVQFKDRVVRSSWQKFMALGKIKKLIFFYRFLKFLTFLENYPVKPGFSVSIEITDWVNVFCRSGYAQLIFFGLFSFEIWYHKFSRHNRMLKAYLYNLLSPLSFRKKVMAFQISENFDTVTVFRKFF